MKLIRHCLCLLALAPCCMMAASAQGTKPVVQFIAPAAPSR